MNTTPPTQDEWRQLYDVAVRLRDMAPWTWLYAGDVFGIRNPETGEIGYVSIMGRNGEHYAVAVYLGAEGLMGFWRVEDGIDEYPEAIWEVPQLQAAFEDRNLLRQEDLAVIKSLELKFRGRSAWPFFRSYVPGYYPWFVSGAEARFLTLCLEQALEMALRLKENPDLLEPITRGLYLIRTPEVKGAEMAWQDRWETPSPTPIMPLPPTVQISQVSVERLTRLSHRPVTFQVDVAVAPMTIREKDDPRPYFPYLLTVADDKTGLILGTEFLVPKPSLQTVWEQAPQHLLNIFLRMEVLPGRIEVCSQRVEMLLQPVTDLLSIELVRVPSLPALQEARDYMLGRFV